MDAPKHKLFAYCLIVLLPILAVVWAMWLVEQLPTMPHDEWIQMFMQFTFGCWLGVIFIWREFRRHPGRTFPRLMATILGGLSLILIGWFVQAFGTMPLSHWLRTLGTAVCLLAICGVALWREFTYT